MYCQEAIRLSFRRGIHGRPVGLQMCCDCVRALGKGIKDLTGREYAANLVQDVGPLSGLTKLLSLNLLANPLKVLSYLTYLPAIQADNPGINLQYDPAPGSVSP